MMRANEHVFGNYCPLGGSATAEFFPFLMDNIEIKPYFYKKRDFYDNKPYHNPIEYVKYQISDDEEIKYFLYDIELYYRKSKGNQSQFRKKLIEKDLYELFNILLWLKPISSTSTSDDLWEILCGNLLSGWYFINLPNYDFTDEEIISDIRSFSKYDPNSF